MSNTGHRTVRRVAKILELVATSERGLRLADLSAAIDAPKSSTHGLVKGLVDVGFLAYEHGYYQRGDGLDRATPLTQRIVVDLAREPMADLANRFNETVVLSTMVGSSLIYLANVESTHAIRFVPPRIRPDRPMPSASMRVFLAFSRGSVAQDYLDVHVADVDLRAKLTEELEGVRREGIAYNRGETYEGMSAAAAGIWNDAGVVACLSVGGPTARIADELDSIGREVQRAADSVTGILRESPAR